MPKAKKKDERYIVWVDDGGNCYMPHHCKDLEHAMEQVHEREMHGEEYIVTRGELKVTVDVKIEEQA